LRKVGGADAAGAREHRAPDNVASGVLPGHGRPAFERPPIPEKVHENIAVNGCGLIVSFGERDEGVNVAVNEAPQMKAPLIIIDAKKFANKNDVGSDGDEIGDRFPRQNGAPLSRSTVCLVLAFHRPKYVRRVSHFVPVNEVGVGCAQPDGIGDVGTFLAGHGCEITPGSGPGCGGVNMRCLADHIHGGRRFVARTCCYL